MFIIRCIARMFPLSDAGFVVSRHVSAALVACEALVLARLLGPESYGYYALVLQLVTLVLYAVGATAAAYYYLYAYYKDRAHQLDTFYILTSLLHYATTTLLVGLVAFLVWPSLLVSLALFWIQAPYFVTEPMLRVRSRF